MKNIFKPGDCKTYRYTVKEDDIAAFHGKVVHRVCSTYVLSREMEWAGRLFVLEMRDEDEEGIGTMIEVKHEGPAFPGDKLLFRSQVISIEGNELMCRIDVETEDGRMVARGRTGQKILPREKIRKLLSRNR